MATYKATKVETGPKAICQNKNCKHMGKHLTLDNFYKSRNPAILHHPFCKECVESSIDINNIKTVSDVLKVLDTPFIMDVWVRVINSSTKHYLGNYLKEINLTYAGKYAKSTYADSVFEITDPEVAQIKEEMMKKDSKETVWSDDWQGYYTKLDLKYLNDYYEGLLNDFKIVTVNHKDYAKKIAQASLAQNKAFHEVSEGIEGAEVKYEKATKMFDMLSKSANFTESRRGSEEVALGCFGKVFDLVEKHNWIPQYVPDDEDMYDKLLAQFANIKRSLE